MFNVSEENDDEIMSEINMTPLVDVMLVLLIIFIIAMPLMNDAININLPNANNKPSQKTSETISLSVNKDGDIYWNKKAITLTALQQQLQGVAQQQPEIHLRGDQHVAYEHIVKVMTAVRHAGIEKLAFVTQTTNKNEI